MLKTEAGRFIKSKVLILIFAVSFMLGAKQSLNECQYEVHQAENELLSIIAVGYVHQGQEDAALLIMSGIYEFPHEKGVYNDFMKEISRKIVKIEDREKANAYILKLLKEKEKNLRYLQKKCGGLK